MTFILPYRGLRRRRDSDDKLTYVQFLKALGPAGYWRWGGNALDEMGANDGTAVGSPNLSAPGLLAGDANTAWLSAAAEAKYVTLPTAIRAILNSSDWTFGAVVKLTLGSGAGDLLGPHSGSHARCMSIAFGSATGIGLADSGYVDHLHVAEGHRDVQVFRQPPYVIATDPLIHP